MNTEMTTEAPPTPAVETQTRPKTGERAIQILQALVTMLEDPDGMSEGRVTTAALAKKVGVSEAALYRHFASKAKMFEGLIEFIESTLLGLTAQIARNEGSKLANVSTLIQVLLEFAVRNKGMTRVLVGDALMTENPRLQTRMNDLLNNLETAIKQGLREATMSGELPKTDDVSARANAITSYVIGRWLRYSKSGFKASPTDGWAVQAGMLLS
jgi:TetR/AcrR family transcriptional regulator